MMLSQYFVSKIAPQLPSARAVSDYWHTLKRYVSDDDNILFVRKFGDYNRRGEEYADGKRRYTVGDNEPALWVYHRCLEGLDANQVLNSKYLIEKLPIAFALTKKEQNPLEFSVGRQDRKFASDGWKHCHILQCSPRGKNLQDLGLVERVYRYLCPFNHFPFPSPRKYKMERDWGEDPQVLNWIIWYLFHQHWQGEARQGFAEFIRLAGGSVPDTAPVDIEVSFEPRAQREHEAFIDDLQGVDPLEKYDHFIAADDNIYSFSKGQSFADFSEFVGALKNWLQYTDEETIGNAHVGVTPWITVTIEGIICKLNADTKRTGVRRFLENLGSPLRVTATTSGKVRMLTNDKDGKKITGFQFYSRDELERPQIISAPPGVGSNGVGLLLDDIKQLLIQLKNLKKSFPAKSEFHSVANGRERHIQHALWKTTPRVKPWLVSKTEEFSMVQQILTTRALILATTALETLKGMGLGSEAKISREFDVSYRQDKAYNGFLGLELFGSLHHKFADFPGNRVFLIFEELDSCEYGVAIHNIEPNGEDGSVLSHHEFSKVNNLLASIESRLNQLHDLKDLDREIDSMVLNDVV